MASRRGNRACVSILWSRIHNLQGWPPTFEEVAPDHPVLPLCLPRQTPPGCRESAGYAQVEGEAEADRPPEGRDPEHEGGGCAMMGGKVAPYPLSLPCGLQQGGIGMEVTNRLEGKLSGQKIETLSQTPIVETLKKARALILDEKNWIQGQEATIGKDGPSVSCQRPGGDLLLPYGSTWTCY